MLIQVNTDNNIQGTPELTQWVEESLTAAFDRFEPQIVRIEVQLTDENGPRKEGVNDKRCLLEARLSGMEPVVASKQGETLEQALDGAIDTLEKALDRKLEKTGQRKGRVSFGGE